MPNIKQQEHLTKDGESDRRHKDNRDDEDQRSSNNSADHLKKDGEPDHRYKENRDDRRSNNHGQEHLTKDGEPDHRYKENRDDGSHHQQRNSRKKSDEEQIDVSDIPTKLDGTADMRYLQSREAVKSGLIGKDEVIEEGMKGNDEYQS